MWKYFKLEEVIDLRVNSSKADSPAFHAGNTGSNPVGDATNNFKRLANIA
ncbi:MAG: hypothetical protein QG552_527 [Thermodesulfobacteriota bacterium]|nr:hypothetical protein [Thermodesulfobacteriota bacterium]